MPGGAESEYGYIYEYVYVDEDGVPISQEGKKKSVYKVKRPGWDFYKHYTNESKNGFVWKRIKDGKVKALCIQNLPQ